MTTPTGFFFHDFHHPIPQALLLWSSQKGASVFKTVNVTKSSNVTKSNFIQHKRGPSSVLLKLLDRVSLMSINTPPDLGSLHQSFLCLGVMQNQHHYLSPKRQMDAAKWCKYIFLHGPMGRLSWMFHELLCTLKR